MDTQKSQNSATKIKSNVVKLVKIFALLETIINIDNKQIINKQKKIKKKYFFDNNYK